jgi:hypothetical protein
MTRAMPPPSPRPRENKSSRRRLAGVSVAVVLVVAVLAVIWVVPRPRPEPTRPAQAGATSSSAPALRASRIGRPGRHGALPRRGVPLVGPTGLRLLVADAPAPFVLDVDQATTQPITGLPTDSDRGVSVVAVAGGALVLSFRRCDRCWPGSSAYLLRRGSTTATRLGTALQVVAARDGQGLWLLSRRNTSGCTLRQVGLDGRGAPPGG